MIIYEKMIKYFIFICMCARMCVCVGVCKRIFVYVCARVLPNCRPIFARSSQAHTVSYAYSMLSHQT